MRKKNRKKFSKNFFGHPSPNPLAIYHDKEGSAVIAAIHSILVDPPPKV